MFILHISWHDQRTLSLNYQNPQCFQNIIANSLCPIGIQNKTFAHRQWFLAQDKQQLYNGSVMMFLLIWITDFRLFLPSFIIVLPVTKVIEYDFKIKSVFGREQKSRSPDTSHILFTYICVYNSCNIWIRVDELHITLRENLYNSNPASKIKPIFNGWTSYLLNQSSTRWKRHVLFEKR